MVLHILQILSLHRFWKLTTIILETRITSVHSMLKQIHTLPPFFLRLFRHALLCLSSWCLLIVMWLFLAVTRVCLQFVVFPDHTYYFYYGKACPKKQINLHPLRPLNIESTETFTNILQYRHAQRSNIPHTIDAHFE